MKRIPMPARKIRWFGLIAAILLAAVVSMMMFPARSNVYSGEALRQRRSDAELGALSKWTFARTGTLEEFRAYTMSGLTGQERECLKAAIRNTGASHDENFDLFKAELKADAFTNFVITTKENRRRVEMPDGEDAFIFAHEKPGRWKDGSVGVYFMNRRVVRLKESDFMKISTQDGMKLKFNPRTYQWTLDVTTR